MLNTADRLGVYVDISLMRIKMPHKNVSLKHKNVSVQHALALTPSQDNHP